MSLLVVGVSHHSASVDLLEQVAVAPSTVPKLLDDLGSAPHVEEVMLLATCNRVEVYAEVDRFHGGVGGIAELLARHSGIALEALTPHLYVHFEEAVAQHLFSVASGMDSMLVGERQVLGQVRAAFRLAQDHGSVGTGLSSLVRGALHAGKRARAETGIDAAGTTLVTVGLGQAADILGGYHGRRALVVGAGAMSAVAVAALQRAGITDITIANRGLERGQLLAERAGGRAIGLSELDVELTRSDVVVSCTGATGFVLKADVIAGAQVARAGAPLVILDLALPRDVEPAVAAVPGVTLVDLEQLGAALEGSTEFDVSADVTEVRRIVAEEVSAYLDARLAVGVSPTVVALRDKADRVVVSELKRLDGRLPELDERTRDRGRGNGSAGHGQAAARPDRPGAAARAYVGSCHLRRGAARAVRAGPGRTHRGQPDRARLRDPGPRRRAGRRRARSLR